MCSKSSTSTSSSKVPNATSQSKTSSYYDASQVDPSVLDDLSEEDKQYEYNSLSTGVTPYTAYYGQNYKCPYEQCSGIKVTAPSESDIVVINVSSMKIS